MTIPKLCPLAEVLGIDQGETDEKSIAHYIGDCACNYSICKFNSNGKICRINDTHRLVSDTNVMLRHLYERLDLVDID